MKKAPSDEFVHYPQVWDSQQIFGVKKVTEIKKEFYARMEETGDPEVKPSTQKFGEKNGDQCHGERW